MEGEDQIVMLELEERLLKDKDGTLKKDIISRLENFLLEIKREMDRGLPPEKFKTLDTIKKGIEFAVKVIENF